MINCVKLLKMNSSSEEPEEYDSTQYQSFTFTFYQYLFYWDFIEPFVSNPISDAWQSIFARGNLVNKLRSLSFPMIICGLVLVFNSYLIFCLVAVKELRKPRFLLIFWQALCDVLSVSVMDFLYFGLFVNDFMGFYTKLPLPFKNFILCHSQAFGQLINEYSTGLVLGFFALERFFFVVFPFKAKFWLTSKFYCFAFLFIVTLDFCLWVLYAAFIAAGE